MSREGFPYTSTRSNVITWKRSWYLIFVGRMFVNIDRAKVRYAARIGFLTSKSNSRSILFVPVGLEHGCDVYHFVVNLSMCLVVSSCFHGKQQDRFHGSRSRFTRSIDFSCIFPFFLFPRDTWQNDWAGCSALVFFFFVFKRNIYIYKIFKWKRVSGCVVIFQIIVLVYLRQFFKSSQFICMLQFRKLWKKYIWAYKKVKMEYLLKKWKIKWFETYFS